MAAIGGGSVVVGGGATTISGGGSGRAGRGRGSGTEQSKEGGSAVREKMSVWPPQM